MGNASFARWADNAIGPSFFFTHYSFFAFYDICHKQTSSWSSNWLLPPLDIVFSFPYHILEVVMPITIKTENIHKKYAGQKTKVALDSIDLQIGTGKLFGLVGSDGAGKTTLLRILSTVMVQTSGLASIAGFDTRKDAEKIRQIIGYMPQEFSQYGDLSLEENLAFFAEIQRVPKAKVKESIDRTLEFTHLTPFRDRAAGKLSGGMKKKLALGCALIHAPQVLILDEPSTGVDPVSRGEFWTILSGVVKDGVTVLVSTPYMDEAQRCNEVGMLHEGKLLSVGTPDEITNSLPFETIEVKAKPRKQMREVVEQTSGILSWHPVGDRLRINTVNHNAQQVLDDLEKGFIQADLHISFLRSVNKTMEDAFVSMVSQEGQTE